MLQHSLQRISEKPRFHTGAPLAMPGVVHPVWMMLCQMPRQQEARLNQSKSSITP